MPLPFSLYLVDVALSLYCFGSCFSVRFFLIHIWLCCVRCQNAPYSTGEPLQLVVRLFPWSVYPTKYACKRSFFVRESAYLYWLPKMSDRWKMTSKIYVILFRSIETQLFFFLLCSFFSSAHFFLFPLLLTFSSLQFAHFFSLLPFTRVTFRRAYDSHFIFFPVRFDASSKMSAILIIDNWPLKFFCFKKNVCVPKMKKKTEFLSKCESESAFNWLRLKLVMFYCCSSCALALIGHLRLCMFGYIINWRIKLANDLQFHANVSMKFNWLN